MRKNKRMGKKRQIIQMEVFTVISQELGERHLRYIRGILREGRIYKGYFYTMYGLEARKFKIPAK